MTLTINMRVRPAHRAVALDEEDPVQAGPFRLVGRIGVGGMGVVYLAAGSDGTPAAVKMLHRHLAVNDEFLVRFRREAELAEKVAAHCTAAVLGADLDAPTPWLATEYIAGPNVREHLAISEPLAGEALNGFAAGLAEALAPALHVVAR